MSLYLVFFLRLQTADLNRKELEHEAQMKATREAQELELNFVERANALEISKMKQVGEVETEKVTNVIKALGTETIRALATSSQDNQVSSRILSFEKVRSPLMVLLITVILSFKCSYVMLGNSLLPI